MEFKEFEPPFKSIKIRFKLSAGLNLETFDTILSGTYLNCGLNLYPRSNSLNSATEHETLNNLQNTDKGLSQSSVKVHLDS